MRFLALRAVALLALILLLWNPASSRTLPAGDQPIVLLDASLSMQGRGAPWRQALDSARALARARGALVWRFGARVAAFDTSAPADGATRLTPALEAAAARGGEVVVITDGAIADAAALPPDLRRRPRVVVVAQVPGFDAYVAGVEGARHVMRGDTVRLRVSYGTAGKRKGGRGTSTAALIASVDGRRLMSRSVTLPDSGLLETTLTLPASLFPRPGWQVLEIRLDGVNDAEPRDDARQFAIDVSTEPAAVVFASPPDWETRFLARTLGDVARLPVRVFVETEPNRWRDAATLLPVDAAARARAASAARLVVIMGDPQRAQVATGRAARLLWTTTGQPGDWYVERPPASPLAGALAGVLWDSLAPATAVALPPRDPRDSNASIALTARLARRGTPRAIVLLQQRGDAGREATITASGLWRWAFRGGASEQAYRSLVAGLVDWLLGPQNAGARERAVPVALETQNGLPTAWRWTGTGAPQPLAISLESGATVRTDTLRFDAAGRAELALPPAAYRYTFAGGAERGVVVVETYSDEWRPQPVTVGPQTGETSARTTSVGLRDRWWLFVIAIAALAGEWAWRRRQGLP